MWCCLFSKTVGHAFVFAQCTCLVCVCIFVVDARLVLAENDDVVRRTTFSPATDKKPFPKSMRTEKNELKLATGVFAHTGTKQVNQAQVKKSKVSLFINRNKTYINKQIFFGSFCFHIRLFRVRSMCFFFRSLANASNGKHKSVWEFSLKLASTHTISCRHWVVEKNLK